MHINRSINGTCVSQAVSSTSVTCPRPLAGETGSKLFKQHPIADPSMGEVIVAVAEVRHGVCDATA